MIDVMPKYFKDSEAFFKVIINAHAEKEFLAMVASRADKIARDVSMTADADTTNMMKGQLSLCYEMADGMVQALKEQDGDANPDGYGGPLE